MIAGIVAQVLVMALLAAAAVWAWIIVIRPRRRPVGSRRAKRRRPRDDSRR